jgi:hypothetical protein
VQEVLREDTCDGEGSQSRRRAGGCVAGLMCAGKKGVSEESIMEYSVV